MTTKVKAHPRPGTRGVRAYLRDKGPMVVRVDVPMDWGAFERIEGAQLRRLAANDEREPSRTVLLPANVWEQREAERQRRRLQEYR